MCKFGVQLKPGCLIHVQTVEMEVKSVHVAFISIGDPCINAKPIKTIFRSWHRKNFSFYAVMKLHTSILIEFVARR
jgi:hypothetical protein